MTRLHRDGPEPVRVLLVASVDVSTAPQGRTGAHFADEVVDRLWLRLRRGVDVDLVQEPWGALRAIQGSLASLSLARYDLVAVVVDPPDAGSSRDRLKLMSVLESVLMRLVLVCRVVLVVVEQEHIAAAQSGPAGFSSAVADAIRSPSIRLSWMRMRAESARSADRVARHLQIAIDPETALIRGTDERPAPPYSRLHRRLQQITQMAGSVFDTSSAAVNLVDGDRLTTVAAVGAELGPQLLAGSLCQLTIASAGLVVIGDTRTAPRLQGFRAVQDEDPVRFYAGYPLVGAGGTARGALCVYSDEPRHADEFDFTYLRDLALLAEGELTTAR